MAIKHKKIHQTLIVGAIGIFLFGCMSSTPAPVPTELFAPSIEQIDKSPFTGIPCVAPCWFGLEVGKSRESEVISLLPALKFINYESIKTYQVSMPGVEGVYGPGVLVEAECVNSAKKCLTLAIVNDILTRIEVNFNYKITQDEAIEYLGEPDYVGYGNLGSERVMCEVYLVWIDSNFILASRFEDLDQAAKYCYIVDDEEKAPSDLPILEARYLSDAELNSYLASISSEFFEFTGTITGK
jgi:hypothetical protein